MVKIVNERRVFAEFIDVYAENPPLWDTSSTEYLSKEHTIHGYEALLRVLKKLNPDATINDVKKKINTMRSNYRKELKKVVYSESMGDDPVYQPKVWWFESVNFIRDLIKPFDGLPTEIILKPKREFSISTCPSEESLQKDEATEGEQEEYYEEVEQVEEEQYVDEHLAYSDEDNVYTPPTISRKRISVQDPFESSIRNKKAKCSTPRQKKTTSLIKEDTFDYLALTWANKLRNISNTQRLFAEKAINDILFEAELGTLNRNSMKINEPTTIASSYLTKSRTFCTETDSSLAYAETRHEGSPTYPLLMSVKPPIDNK